MILKVGNCSRETWKNKPGKSRQNKVASAGGDSSRNFYGVAGREAFSKSVYLPFPYPEFV